MEPPNLSQFRNRKLQKTQHEHLFPKQLCVMLSALPQPQCLTEESLFSAHENPTPLQLKIEKYQQTLPLTQEEILCTYKKKFCSKAWKQNIRTNPFSTCNLCIYFMHRNVLCYLTSTPRLSEAKLQASMTSEVRKQEAGVFSFSYNE